MLAKAREIAKSFQDAAIRAGVPLGGGPGPDDQTPAQARRDAMETARLEIDAVANGEGTHEDIVVKGPLRLKTHAI